MQMTQQHQKSGERKSRPTIVCIDDDPDILYAIALVLSKFEVDVIRALTGQQGIWQTLCKKPDLVITDCRMPQGEGELVLESLRSLRNTWCMPVIVLTGLRDAQLESRMRRLGAKSYLLKPVSTRSLLVEIGKYIELRAASEDTVSTT
jgi:response regulator RpfG family c-di-GMP phosphodiesterase